MDVLLDIDIYSDMDLDLDIDASMRCRCRRRYRFLDEVRLSLKRPAENEQTERSSGSSRGVLISL